jgi:quercetin dioxygenase-like cupin family protein
MNTRNTAVLILAMLSGTASFAHAHGPGAGDGEEKVHFLQQRKLSDAPGKTALVFTVEYAPGQRSIPHLHGGSAVAYVLEGAVTSQLEGEQPVTYRAGQSWYEKPRTGHLVSRNASNTKPARLVVWILNEGDEPLLTPLPSTANAKAP